MSQSFFLCVLVLFSVRVATAASKEPYFSASCLYHGPRCSRLESSRSKACAPTLSAKRQSRTCVVKACSYCMRKVAYQRKFPCNANEVASLCGYESAAEQPVSALDIKAPSPKPCVWTSIVSEDTVTVDLSKVRPSSGWTRCTRNGMGGLVYKRHLTQGMDGKGEHGVLCFDVRAPSSGTFYLTALSYAPHGTDNNDAWVRCSKPMSLWRLGRSKRTVGAKTWLKVYQNKGTRGISEDWKTINNNGHRLLIPGLSKNEMFQVCLSGRSYQYEIFSLVMVRCSGAYCKGKAYEDITRRAQSVCREN